MKKRIRRTARLEAWLGATATPVFLLNARRQLIFFNAGCEQLTGWSAADVVGTVCDYATDDEAGPLAALAGSLCPPPEVLAGRPASVPVYLSHRQGQSTARLLNFFPMTDAEGLVDSVLGLVTPIAQPKQPAANPAQQLHAELAALRNTLRQRFGMRTLVCRSEPMIRVLEQINVARSAKAACTIIGEPGTGKEHVARLVHNESEFRTRSFVPLDCRHTPAVNLKRTLRRLFEGEGDERDAARLPPGLQPGTVFLADVDCLPRDLQQLVVELAAARQKTSRPPLRLVGASTADLHAAVTAETLRGDFFYLLTTLEIELPPLRRRREDLELLAQAFLEALNRNADRQVGGFAEEVWRQFREYNWPGNLNELQAVVAEARAASTGDLIQVGDLPFRFRTGLDAQGVGPAVRPQLVPLKDLLARVEREQIEAALEQARHNKSKAADLLGITRAGLYRRMEVLGIADLEAPD